jgi:predicted nucleotidyltransferase
VDAVADYMAEPTALELLRELEEVDSTRVADHTLVIAGAEVQFLDVTRVTESGIEGLEEKQVLFVAGHAMALTGARPMRLCAEDGSEAVVPVAPAGALIVTKLHAYIDRRGQGQDKKPGDLWDLYHLLSFSSRQAAEDLADALPTLRRVLVEAVGKELVENAQRARVVLRQSSDERYQAIGADEFAFVAQQFLRLMASA